MKNRLRLDFSLQTAEERLAFLDSYLPTLTFVPNEHEQETLSDYVLWGKNQDGLNAQQEGIAVIKEWAPNSQVESLDGLMELPGFQETKLQRIGDTHYKTSRIVFDREAALAKAPQHLIPTLEDLFHRIDETELLINFYELENGKRTNDPRSSLLARFTENEIMSLRARASKITPRRYLQLRHYLVELRTEQYTYYDSIDNAIMPHVEVHIELDPGILRIDEDIAVRPFGLMNGTELARKIFMWPPDPFQFTEEELKKVSDMIWADPPKTYIDFENPEHILALYKNYNELRGDMEEDPDQLYGSAASIIETLEFYEKMAKLTDSQRDLL